MPYDFLLVSWGTSGNLTPVLTAARQLRRKGHRLRVMADPAMRGEVTAAEFEFVTWRRAPTGLDADPTDFSDMAEWVRKTICSPALAYAHDIQDEIRRTPTDAVLSLDVLFGVVLGAQAAGVPVAMFSPHVSIRPLEGLPPAVSGLLQPKTAEERAEVAQANEGMMQFLNSFVPELNQTCSQLGIPALADGLDIFDRSERILFAISRAFDFQADAIPENFRYVGPLLDEPGWSKPWQAPWAAWTVRPRVLIAGSTGAQGQRDMIQRILDAVGTLDVDAVATAGPNLDVNELKAPANVHLLHSAPHNAVMKEVSLVITQGGHGTVCRALTHGLPMLVMPKARDQHANAARVEARGAGLRLEEGASPEAIAAAVRRLTSEPGFPAAARQLGAAIRADMGAFGLVTEMEAMVERRRSAMPERRQASGF